jgi:hypothetical protein
MQNKPDHSAKSTSTDLINPPDHLIKLAEGFSTQTQTASKFWLALAIVSAIVVIPVSNGTSIKIPFDLGTVPQTDFYPFSALLISILIIGFGSAHIQSIRSRKLIQRVIDSLNNQVYLPGQVHVRDFLDSIVSPSISRTAPLAQYLRTKHQFFPESSNASRLKNLISTSAYCLLKIATILVIYLFPGFALLKSAWHGGLLSICKHTWGIPNLFFVFITIVATLILLELLISEIKYTVDSIRAIIKKEAS